MEERELQQLLQQLGDRTTPSPPPVQRIVDAGEALRGRRRSGRVRVFAVAAAAAAVVGGGAVAATVLDLPTSGGDASSAGQAESGVDDSGGGSDSGPAAGRDTSEDGASAADAASAVVVTPDVLQPGDTFELTSRDPDAGFGLAWDLQRFTDAGATREYVLAAAFQGGDPRWWREGESWDVAAALVSPPLEFVVPPDAPAGDYLLCEHDDPEVCASLTVAG
jgi:hypothetical protein